MCVVLRFIQREPKRNRTIPIRTNITYVVSSGSWSTEHVAPPSLDSQECVWTLWNIHPCAICFFVCMVMVGEERGVSDISQAQWLIWSWCLLTNAGTILAIIVHSTSLLGGDVEIDSSPVFTV